MLLRWLLFESKAGELLLTLLEKTAGLAIVESSWLGNQTSGKPVTERGG